MLLCQGGATGHLQANLLCSQKGLSRGFLDQQAGSHRVGEECGHTPGDLTKSTSPQPSPPLPTCHAVDTFALGPRSLVGEVTFAAFLTKARGFVN